MSGTVRPVIRGIILASELVVASFVMLLLGGVALADSSPRVAPGTASDVSGGAVQVQTDGQSQIVSNSSQTTEITSSTDSASSTGGVIGGSSNGNTTAASADVTPASSDATPVISLVDSAGPTVGASSSLATLQAAQPVTTPANTSEPAAPALASGSRSMGRPQFQHFAYSTIYSQTSVPVSAAESVPAASSAPAREPVKSTGLLGQLNDHLMAAVVPGNIRLATNVPINLPTSVSLVAICVILSSLIVSNFGESMRLSRFVHAARSDLPNTSFAPPHLLGYVPAWGRAT